MSHYVDVSLKLQGDAEAIVRALCQMERSAGGTFDRSMIESHAERVPVHGFDVSVRPEHAHIVIRRQHVGGVSNDIGFEKRADGSWIAHVSDYDRGTGDYAGKRFYGDAWMSRLLSRWAIQRVGLEAEKRGYNWAVQNETSADGRQFAYVRVSR